LSKLHIIKMHG